VGTRGGLVRASNPRVSSSQHVKCGLECFEALELARIAHRHLFDLEWLRRTDEREQLTVVPLGVLTPERGEELQKVDCRRCYRNGSGACSEMEPRKESFATW
jgi:hypothetical protein